MATIPAPTLVLPREEWPDADFDLPEGEPIHAPYDKGPDDEDWDIDMSATRSEGQRPLTSSVARIVAQFESNFQLQSQPRLQPFTIHPPLSLPQTGGDDDDDDEGVSTIKAVAFLKPVPKEPQLPIDEDFEDAFALPSDLTQLSLAPLSLNHRSSKNSLEWGDKDQTSSSQSSDAYSSLGFADASPSSNSASSVSLPETETEEEDHDDELEGVVIPSALFESGKGAQHLAKILEMRRKTQVTANRLKVTSPNPEDDFEMGLVIDDDVDLSPSRLLSKAPQSQPQRSHSRSHTIPPQPSSYLRPPSRANRAKSPLHPPTSSMRQLRKVQTPPSPPLHVPTRSQTFQILSSASPGPSTSASSFLSPKPSSLRGQKSYSGLKPLTPPSTLRTLTRKASLSSLVEISHAQASGSGSNSAVGGSKSRYEEPTAASRAKSHKYSTSRVNDFKVTPTRPHTPSSNPVALRLTMPTQSRPKVRPPLSNIFGAPTSSGTQSPAHRTTSPPLPRPPSTLSIKSIRITSNPTPAAPKLLRRPKRQRTYGDGSELDGIEDLPTDREREGRFRVQPKAYGNRIPGAYYPPKSNEKFALQTKGRPDTSVGNNETNVHKPLTSSANTLRRAITRIEFPSKTSSPNEKHGKKKVIATSSPRTRRKPTLIRNLGSSNAPKVVGDMKWNPLSLRWEGNDHVLRDFDAVVGTSARPALITHLTGSSVGSPVGSFASGARIVGNMIFDPARMCWVSILPPDEDEPDIFANLADDEEDSDGWEAKGGTIRANAALGTEANVDSSTLSRAEAPSPAHSHTRTISESGSDRGSRASMVFDVDESFLESCRIAEERHRNEMKGWMLVLAKRDVCVAPDRSSLYDIRALATRKY